MIKSEKTLRRLKLNRPSLRARARPPKQRTPLGAQFGAANLPVALAMQTCTTCGHVQYPPTELCGECLEDALIYRPISSNGTLLTRSELHHSLWEYFKRRLKSKSWSMGSVQLDAGPVVIVHIGDETLQAGDPVQVFSHTDASQSTVLIAVNAATPISAAAERRALVQRLGLDQPAVREGGI